MDFFNSLSGAADAAGILGAQKALGLDVKEAFKDAKDTYGEIRKAGKILKSHPLGAIAADLIFPDPVADGTLDGARERGAITRYERGY